MFNQCIGDKQLYWSHEGQKKCNNYKIFYYTPGSQESIDSVSNIFMTHSENVKVAIWLLFIFIFAKYPTETESPAPSSMEVEDIN